MPLDPVVQAVLEQAAAADAPALHELSATDARAMYRLMNEGGEKIEIFKVTDTNADGVPVRIYQPTEKTADQACLIYYHGGGWVIGDLETHDAPCRLLAKQTGAVVIAVDYRLAPEHPYPASVDDCYTATCWVFSQAATLGLDETRIAVGGDSAGGNLAAVMALKLRDHLSINIKYQLLIYPVTDGKMDSQSYIDNAEGYLLTRDTMAWFWDQYADESLRHEVNASPINAASLGDLPATSLFTAEFDPLCDEGADYADKLGAAGNQVHYQKFDGLIHGFVSMTAVIPAAAKAFSEISKSLKTGLNL